jgi:uncharacterized glyoxalase superfamily protein PhnB
MPNHPSDRPSACCPYLFYDDVSSAIHFLTATFGLEERFVDRDDHGKVHHAQLACGAAVVMLGETGVHAGYRARKSPVNAGSLNAGVYLFVDDVDAHVQRARARRVQRSSWNRRICTGEIGCTARKTTRVSSGCSRRRVNGRLGVRRQAAIFPVAELTAARSVYRNSGDAARKVLTLRQAVSVSAPLAPRDLFELAGRESEALRWILEGFASQSLEDFAGARFAGRAGLLEIEECRAQALNGEFVLTRGDGACRLQQQVAYVSAPVRVGHSILWICRARTARLSGENAIRRTKARALPLTTSRPHARPAFS